MQTDKSFSVRSRLRSFRYAGNGLRHLIRAEPNALIHLLATVLVIAAGFLMQISRGEWFAIVVAIAVVWLAEGFNTCIELLCDLFCDGKYDRRVGIIKDISAAVVLIASIAAALIGIIVFLL